MTTMEELAEFDEEMRNDPEKKRRLVCIFEVPINT